MISLMGVFSHFSPLLAGPGWAELSDWDSKALGRSLSPNWWSPPACHTASRCAAVLFAIWKQTLVSPEGQGDVMRPEEEESLQRIYETSVLEWMNNTHFIYRGWNKHLQAKLDLTTALVFGGLANVNLITIRKILFGKSTVCVHSR